MPMNLNQPTLYDFEKERSNYKYRPPQGSDTFHHVSDGEIDLLTEETFSITIIDGKVQTGYNFIVSSDLYSQLYVCEDTSLEVTRELTVEDNGLVDIRGKLLLDQGSDLTVRNKSTMSFQLGSSFTITPNTRITVSDDSSLLVFGNIYCHHSKVNELYNNPNIYIDNSATLYVTGLDDLGERPYSLTEYTVELRSEQLTPHSQGEFDTNEGKLGFNTVDVDYDSQYQLLDLSVMRGSAVLGDFKYSVLGSPERKPSSTQIVNSLTIEENSMLVVSDSFNGATYINPTLYIGPIIDNSILHGKLTVHGDLLVSGIDSSIVLDRGGWIEVSETGTIRLDEEATIVVSNNTQIVLKLDGTLILHTLDQLVNFFFMNIFIGETGKIVILNDTYPDNTILFSTPNGINDTYLHSLFFSDLSHIEYHIPSNCGIKIDESMDEYRTMSKWFSGMRLEDAIEKGLIVWDDAFIDLDVDVVPWARDTKNLFNIPKLFNTYPSISEKERLQELVDYLSMKGISSIKFHITKGGRILRELTLNLQYPKINHVSYSSVEDSFTVDTDNPGKFFTNNKISYLKKENILSKDANVHPITKKENGKTNVQLNFFDT